LDRWVKRAVQDGRGFDVGFHLRDDFVGVGLFGTAAEGFGDAESVAHEQGRVDAVAVAGGDGSAVGEGIENVRELLLVEAAQ
jgi:hypothetical protein